MQISRATEYAVMGLVHLATAPGKSASSVEISEKYGISVYFIRNIFQKLKEEKLIKSVKGSGYILAKKAEKISLKTVLEAVEGKILIHDCLGKKSPACRQKPGCKILAKWAVIQKNFLTELEKVRLSDLI